MKKGVGIIIGILFGLNIVLVVVMVLMLTGVIDVKINKNNDISTKNEEKINNTNKNDDMNKDDEKYASIIDEYRRAMNDSDYDYTDENKYPFVNSTVLHHYHNYKNGNYEGSMTLNYVYYDINKDGNLELIVATNHNSKEYNIAEIYTYDGSKANAFFKSVCLGERCNAHIYENGIIYFYGASGAAVHGLTFYKIGSDGYSRETVKDFGVEINDDGVYNIESDGVKTEFKSDDEAINSVVGDTKKVDLFILKWIEIK